MAPNRKAKLAEQKARGEAAKRILETGPVKDALDKMDAEIVAAFKVSAVADHEVRENAHKMFLLLERFKGCLRQCVAEGSFASKELLLIEEEDKTRPETTARRDDGPNSRRRR